ncbi:hypothetical protein NAT51_07950 [Flavobacterium amniphilum]|uniref:hypothetical protein n=1 Tax=Flavobacterium amniphilum TaxID=1834035 RepID=UPI00202A889A|nr:hypothetical protein [Flavobacterium amniphilum]MCL9805450.1 hypothetical protein [Flavobacterium amniphilum]
MKRFFGVLVLMGCQYLSLHAQEQKAPDAVMPKDSKIAFAAYDGMVVAGYVDQGGFLNFTGPNISWSKNNSKIMVGMLPSLRFKEDDKEPKNSFITPGLGVGLTYSYKRIAFQLPLYYTAKTATDNGKWNCGIGIGIRLKK